MDAKLLMDYGIDYDKGLKNCMGNAAFYKRILSMFLQDKCFPQAVTAHRCGNQKELFSRMHELKGISGNAALFELYNAVVPLVELLRHFAGGDTSEIDRHFALAESTYKRACEGIVLLLAEK